MRKLLVMVICFMMLFSVNVNVYADTDDARETIKEDIQANSNDDTLLADSLVEKLSQAIECQTPEWKNEAEEQEDVQERNTIIAVADQFLGVHYSWGGTTPKGFDCSGFTQYVFNINGYSIGRTANNQTSNGQTIERNNLNTGDLIFFQGTYRTTGASHVGIYIEDNKFIHCASGGVQISSLDENYWASHYYTARRII